MYSYVEHIPRLLDALAEQIVEEVFHLLFLPSRSLGFCRQCWCVNVVFRCVDILVESSDCVSEKNANQIPDPAP